MKVITVRHTRDNTFKYVGDQEDLSPLIQNVKIRVGTCHTHGRRDRDGIFTDIEKSVDVRVKLEVDKCLSALGCDTLGKFMWEVSMKISDVLGG